MQRALDLGFGFEEFTTKLNCEGDMGGAMYKGYGAR